MKKILKILWEIISKIIFSLNEEESNKTLQERSVNVNIENYVNCNNKKIEKIDIVSGTDNIYVNELIKEIVIKIEFADCMPASFVEVEFSVENLYGPVKKVTDENGIVSFQNIRLEESGTHCLCIKSAGGFIYKDLIKIKDNPLELKFISQPQDVSSEEILNEVVVQAIYKSGIKAENLPIQIDVNKEGVSLSGTRLKNTDKEGKVYFDNLIFTKTGNYKLRAICKNISLYSEPFHVFAPGVCIDFEKCESGSKEEVETFLTALLEKQNDGDVIKYNGKEY